MLPISLPSEKLNVKRYGLGAWSGHVPFAYDLMASLKPSIFVELGCHQGESYSAFCQAVSDFGLNTVCYGVDTWKGDKHAGFYEEKIYENLLAFNQKNYGGFSYLLRKDFDSAQQQFSDESIDLLHIDGLHTYDAVKHDFETWLPKIKKSGAILFHDTVVRHDDFGVWKFWEELQAKYSTFSFHHGYGLGVLFLDRTKLPSSPLLDFLVSTDLELAQSIRSSYFNAYQKLQSEFELSVAQEKCRDLEKQLFETVLKQEQLQYKLNRRAYRWTTSALSFLDRHSWLKLGV